MNKSILIIDMPNNCYECDYCGYAIIDSNEGNEYKYRSCALSQRYLGEIEENCKDSLCPLKPLPQKKDLREYAEEIGADFNLQTRIMDYVNGYNKCIYEILGDNDE